MFHLIIKTFDRISDKRNFPRQASIFGSINPDSSSGSR